MSLLNKLKKVSGVSEEVRDTLGGNRTKESDVYGVAITMAYLDAAKSGAVSFNLIAKCEDGSDYRETIYVTNKEGSPTYTDKNSGKAEYLPGYLMADTICQLITGAGLGVANTEPKMVKIWDFEQRKEVPQEKEVLVDLIGGKIKFGILKITEDKQTKGDNGEYHANGETRDVNQIDKPFHYDTGLTLTEGRAGKTEGEFINQWTEANKGKTRNKAKGAAGGATAGKPASKPTTSIFG